MNKRKFALIAIPLNVLTAIGLYRIMPHWSGICIGIAMWSLSDLLKSFAPPEPPSTFSTNYNVGWADGWNACRTTEPEDRVFIRTGQSPDAPTM